MKKELEVKKKTWRNQTKLNNLDKRFTLKRRQEFLETEYINGVIDNNGKLVIRRLTDEEKEWLNLFYKETLNTSFEELNSLYPVPGISKLSKDNIKEIRGLFLNKNKSINKDLLNTMSFVKELARRFKVPADTIINIVKRKELYDANNALNNDLIKNGLRTTCEYNYNDDSGDDYYYPITSPIEYNYAFETAINDYLDFKHRRDMGWEDLPDED